MTERAGRIVTRIPQWVIGVVLLVGFAWAGWSAAQIGRHTRLDRPPATDAGTDGAAPQSTYPIDSLPQKPLLQLELARTPGDIEAIVKAGTTEQRIKNIDRLRQANEIDTWHFIPAYFLVLVGVTLFIARSSGQYAVAVGALGVAAAATIAGSDLLENRSIEHVLAKLADGHAAATADVVWISIPATVKWMLLGILPGALGAVAWLQQGWRRLLAPVLLVVAAAVIGPLGRYFVYRLWQ